MNTQRLKIAYVGNFRPSFSTETHVAASLEELGHEVVRLQEDSTPWARVAEVGRGCHLVLWTRTWGLDHEGCRRALEELHAEGVPTVSFHLDRYIGLDREAQIRQGDPFWSTQFVFTADGGNQAKFEHYGVNHFWLPPAVYGAETNRALPNRRLYPHKVVFVGSHPYPHAEWRPYRSELIGRLEERYGDEFTVWPKQRRPIRGHALNQLYASAVVAVGDSCLSPDPDPLPGENPGTPAKYWSDRIPETIGRGGLLIHPEVGGLRDWYRNGKHLLTYRLGDFEDLMAKVEWALNDAEANERIRAEGHELVVGRDTYKHRLVAVLDVVLGATGRWRDLPVELGRHRGRYRNQRPVEFRVREGHPTDRQVIDEVWRDATYPVERAMVQGRVVVDIGANIGAFSVLAATMQAAQVHAYEPEPGNAALLRRNVAAYPAVIVHETALGGANGEVGLIPGPEGAHGGGTHSKALPDGHDWPSDIARVPVVHVAEGLPEGPIALVKMDCEGAEYSIIEAMDDSVLSRIERIMMEFHGPLMPHLAHLDEDGRHMDRWKAMVAKLADYGRTEIFGHPPVGGTIMWKRY